jgi:ABC-type oligopeptide transport system ATPase subunit
MRQRVEGLMAAVGLAPHHLQRYPHEFSGGQQRRLALLPAHER